MEVARRGGPYRCVLLFPRVSSTGTMSCLYPLHHPPLLSFVNLGAEDKIIYVPDVRSHQLIHQFHCEALIRSMRFYRVAIGLISFISSAGLPHVELTSWLMKKNGFLKFHFCFEAPFVWTRRTWYFFGGWFYRTRHSVSWLAPVLPIITLLMLPKAHIPIFH